MLRTQCCCRLTDCIEGDEPSSAPAADSSSGTGTGAGGTDMDAIRQATLEEGKNNPPPLGFDKADTPQVNLQELRAPAHGVRGDGHSHGMDTMVDAMYHDGQTSGGLMKMGLKTALAIGLHNFPEGLATFIATLDDPSVGVSLVCSLCIYTLDHIQHTCIYTVYIYDTLYDTHAL